jgi:phosphocarrier protein HPr
MAAHKDDPSDTAGPTNGAAPGPVPPPAGMVTPPQSQGGDLPCLRHTVQIANPLGFHMRPKMTFAQTAARYQSRVRVLWQGQEGDGKSMWDLMLLAAPQGAEITVEVAGPDAADALEALVAVLAAPSADEPSDPSLGDNI